MKKKPCGHSSKNLLKRRAKKQKKKGDKLFPEAKKV